MTTGFGTDAQRRAYIRRCLAEGATVESVAYFLGLDADTVRRIASEAEADS